MTLHKVFDKDGDSVLRFAINDVKGIAKWLNEVDIEYAMKYATLVEDPVFHQAYEFPCKIIEDDN